MITLGAHLLSTRTGYTHHGIYVGGGKVVHYAGLANGLSKGAICETAIEDFNLNRDEIIVIKHIDEDVRFSPTAIVKRAKDRLGENEYNLIFNNCEHFATWCVTGKAESQQVKKKILYTVKISSAGYNTYHAYKTAQAISDPLLRAVASVTKGQLTRNTVMSAASNSAFSHLTAAASGPSITRGIAATASGVGMTTAAVSSSVAGSSAIAGIVGSSAVVAAAPVVLAVSGVALAGYGAIKLWEWITD
ncbi:NC domain [Yersinia massiliensis]|uniref:lecithin retinol acyltransferase family protein n=1 Tax=Yersinia massiliensis TaxID=419257 RepID=UPI0005EA2A6A|nr:lecithin retinol acyltransferase family protein [Yersinia massiliensis]CNI43793.1 NC domain [Yersinia massiliensis]